MMAEEWVPVARCDVPGSSLGTRPPPTLSAAQIEIVIGAVCLARNKLLPPAGGALPSYQIKRLAACSLPHKEASWEAVLWASASGSKAPHTENGAPALMGLGLGSSGAGGGGACSRGSSPSSRLTCSFRGPVHGHRSCSLQSAGAVSAKSASGLVMHEHKPEPQDGVAHKV